MATEAEKRLLYGGGGGGAGGKFERHGRRKPQSTPYARPLAAPVRQKGGWIQKIITPASRLATRFLPSFFSTPQPSPRDSPEPAQDEKKEIIDEVQGAITHVVETSESCEYTDVDMLKDNTQCEVHKSSVDGINVDSELSDVEKLLKQQTFTRDEYNRLIMLLRSRMASSSYDNAQPEATMDVELAAVEGAREYEEPNVSFGHMQDEPLDQRLNEDDAGSSPVEIAKAFIKAQAVGSTVTRQNLRDERTPSVNTFGSRFSLQSPVQKSPICWPVSIVQNTPSYVTPQTNRNPIGLHGLAHSPYSRPPSKFSAFGQRPSTQWRKEATPFCKGSQTQAMKRTSGVDESSTTVGPIQRTRLRDLEAATPNRGSLSYSLKSAGRLSSTSNVLVASKNNKMSEPMESMTVRNYSSDGKITKLADGRSTVHPQSSKVARKILEHLDRTFPSPKEKSAELNLVLQRRMPTFGVTTPTTNGQSQEKGDFCENTGNKQASALGVEISNPATGSSMINSWLPTKVTEDVENVDNPPNKSKNLENLHNKCKDVENSHSKTDKDVFASGGVQFQNLNQVSAHVSWGDKLQQRRPQFSMSGTKPALSSIAVVGEDGSRLTSDSGAGFTFPLAAGAHGELPTPTMVVSFAAPSTSHYTVETTVPHFSFGSSNSERRLVFSFACTSGSSKSDTSVPKFSFGHGSTKGRTSFSSVTKKVTC